MVISNNVCFNIKLHQSLYKTHFKNKIGKLTDDPTDNETDVQKPREFYLRVPTVIISGDQLHCLRLREDIYSFTWTMSLKDEFLLENIAQTSFQLPST